MGNCFLHGNGGNQLDFKLVAYATEDELLAATPKENTIGVETDSFNGYVIDATEPENPTDRMLWVQVSDTSPRKFPATKDKTIYIKPVKCWQYVDGDWKVIVSYLYKDATWKAIGRLYLYRNRDYNRNIANELKTLAFSYSSQDNCKTTFASNERGLGIYVTTELYGEDAKKGACNIFQKSEPGVPLHKYDLTDFKTLNFTGFCDPTESSSSSVIYGCWDVMGAYGYSDSNRLKASAKFTKYNSEPVVIDVSALEGEYFIGVGVRCAHMVMEECYLEM